MRNSTLRQSNIELLRLLSMLLVMIVHANSLSNKMPQCADVTNTLPTVTRIMVQTFANVNVDVFVLISGWFGIRLRLGGIMNILFQCLFYSILALGVSLWLFPNSFSVAALIKSLYFGSCYWFVVSYLGLMVISPILNTFAEQSDRKTLKIFLVGFFLFEAIYGWMSLDEAHFINGYSFVSFMGLYLLARYVKMYPSRWFAMPKLNDLYVYAGTCLLSGAIIFVVLCAGNDSVAQVVKDKMLAYNSPLCIIAACYLLMFFTKLDIGCNKEINWFAASAFAIYLIHCNPLIMPKYLQLMRDLYMMYDSVVCLLVMLAVILMLIMSFILIDKVRLVLWKKIVR